MEKASEVMPWAAMSAGTVNGWTANPMMPSKGKLPSTRLPPWLRPHLTP